MQTVRITNFSDALCVWAYVSQIRYDELLAQFQQRVAIQYHFFQVFGDVQKKMRAQWAGRGGLRGYAAHVQDIASGFDHVSIHPEVWLKETPASSMPAHLFLCAVRELEQTEEVEAGTLARVAWMLRTAFFTECANVASRRVLLALGERVDIPAARIEVLLDSGRAHAALSDDLDLARERSIGASPTMVLNDDRQRLTGNVGYRVIEANVRELLERPANQQSWC